MMKLLVFALLIIMIFLFEFLVPKRRDYFSHRE
jgi:hypothetical protein